MAETSPALSSLGRIGFIGAGAAGSALARVFAARGARIAAVAARRPWNAEALVELLPPGAQALPPEDLPDVCDLVFLAVSDDAIPTLAADLPWRSGQGVVHLSGAQAADALAAVHARGALPAALHPLMTLSPSLRDLPADALLARLVGCAWALEAADDGLRRALEAIVAALGGQPIHLRPEDRLPYHIAAVFASNYVVALIGGAAALWGMFGEPPGTAVHALLPLLRAAVENTAANGPAQALTGPIARGDAGTLNAHLAWLDAHAADPAIVPIRDAYLALARLALPLAEARGALPSEILERMRTLLGSA
jgi:predicted short-subunit dehydrogenase-like oxidoreductase (DUF2520 family)